MKREQDPQVPPDLDGFEVPSHEPDWYDVPFDGVPAPADSDVSDDATPRPAAKESQAVTLVRMARSLYTFVCDEAGTAWAIDRALPGVAVPLKGNDDEIGRAHV